MRESQGSPNGRGGVLTKKKIKVRNANAQENELTFAYDALSGRREHFEIRWGKSIFGEYYL